MQILISLIIVIALFVIGIRCLEYKSIFYPVRSIAATPAFIGIPFEDIFFKTEDGVSINAWLVKSSTARGTVIICHGNAGNIGDRLEKIRLFHQLGFNVFIIDYRGYGKSQGRPSEAGLYKDAVGAYDYLRTRKDIDHKHLIGYGASLGGAVIIDLATRRELAALIIHSSFTNAADMAKTIYPFLPSFLLGTKLDSLTKVRTLKTPKIFIHSREDEMIPFRLGERLYQEAAAPKEFLESSGGHNDILLDFEEKIARELVTFLRRYNSVDDLRVSK